MSSLEKARSARSVSVKPGNYAVQGRMQIRKAHADTWTAQSSKDRGDCWEVGLAIESELPSLMGAIARISGQGYPSVIVDSEITLMLGDRSVSAPTHIEAVLKLLKEVLKDG